MPAHPPGPRVSGPQSDPGRSGCLFTCSQMLVNVCCVPGTVPGSKQAGETCSLPCRTHGQARVGGWDLKQESHLIRLGVYKRPSGCQEEKSRTQEDQAGL